MITPEQLCKALTEHDGEEVTDLKQVVKISFSGYELLEFINSFTDPSKVIATRTSGGDVVHKTRGGTYVSGIRTIQSQGCVTCKHYELHGKQHPCNSCDLTNNLWEAVK